MSSDDVLSQVHDVISRKTEPFTINIGRLTRNPQIATVNAPP